MLDDLKMKEKSWITIIIYIVAFYLLGSILIMIVSYLFQTDTFSYKDIINAMSNETQTEDLKRLCAYVNTISNTIIYACITIFMIIYLKEVFISDFNRFKENLLRNVIVIVVAGALFFTAVYFLDKLIIYLTSTTSSNQYSIELSFGYKVCTPFMFIVTVFLGPIVEEVIFRKSIFTLLNKKHFMISVAVSALMFALPHMMSTKTSFGDWMLLLIPYLFSGITLGLLYHFGEDNLFITIPVHMINNLIAVLIILI